MKRAIYVVTGARDWPGDVATIEASLRDFGERFPRHYPSLYHGACPGTRSVDALAAMWATAHGWTVAPFFADWNTYGNAAGPRRNAEMVAVAQKQLPQGHAVEVHAWPSPASRGTWDCARAAGRAGLVLFVHREGLR